MTNNKNELLDVEKADTKSPVEKRDFNKPTGSPNRRLWLAIGALVLLGVAVFAIAFPIANNNRNNSKDQSVNKKVYANEYVSPESNAFNVKLHMFGTDITRGYHDSKEVEEDLRNAAMFLMNNAINRNIGKEGFESLGFGQANPNMWLRAPTLAAPEMAADGAPAGGSEQAKVSKDVNDFGTNNQEDDVEEGDVIVSDGKHVFAAFGDSLVAWDANTGELVTRIKMPAINVTETVTEDDRRFGFGWYKPRPWIRHLLLQDQRLLVIVEGYGSYMTPPTERAFPVLHSYLSTHVRLYEISAEDQGLLQLVSVSDINGYFSDARAVNGNVHIVTTTGIDTYTDLIAPYEYYNFDGMTRDEYVAMVKESAEEKSIPKFVNDLVTEMGNGGGFPNLFRISLMQSEASGKELEEILFGDGVVNSLVQVHSFDMRSSDLEIPFVKSGAFLPTSWVQVYGASNALIIAGEGWEYNPDDGTSIQSTHLLGVAIEGASSNPFSIGKLDGYILNSRSVDVKGDVLRIATTIRNNTFWFSPMPMPIDEPMEEWSKEGDNEVITSSSKATVPVDSTIMADSMPREELRNENDSSTQNYVITLDLTAEDGVMKELGRVQLGKPNEVFTAVRFFDNIAYAVTFERRDPLYVLDLNDPTKPSILGELDISGFSTYMHSMNDNNTMILAIGEETNDDGWSIGVQISIFDMTDLSNPKLAQRFVIANDENTNTYSDSLWDFKSIRYTAGRLMIPMTINDWRYDFADSNATSTGFSGFIVYVVNENLIEEECRISHIPDNSETDAYHCYCNNGYLPRRSMVFNGNLMTTEDHFVRSTDLNTCQQIWKLDITDEYDSEDSCYCYGIPEIVEDPVE